MASSDNIVDFVKNKDGDECDTSWTMSLENLYRYRTAGYRDEEEYRKHRGLNTVLYKNGMIKKLNTSDGHEITFPNSPQLHVQEQLIRTLKGKNLTFENIEFAKKSRTRKKLQSHNKKKKLERIVMFHGPKGNYNVLPFSYNMNLANMAAQLLSDILIKTLHNENISNHSRRDEVMQFPVVWSEIYTCIFKNKGSKLCVVREKDTLTYYSFDIKRSGENDQLECTIRYVSGHTEIVLLDVRKVNFFNVMECLDISNWGQTISSAPRAPTSSNVNCQDTEDNDNSVTDEIHPVDCPRHSKNSSVNVDFSYGKGINYQINTREGRNEQVFRESERFHHLAGNTGIFEKLYPEERKTAYYSTSYSRYRNFSDSKYLESLDMYMQKTGNNIPNEPPLKIPQEVPIADESKKRYYMYLDEKNHKKTGIELKEQRFRMNKSRGTERQPNTSHQMKNEVYRKSRSHYKPQLESQFHCPSNSPNTPRRIQYRTTRQCGQRIGIQKQNDYLDTAWEKPRIKQQRQNSNTPHDILQLTHQSDCLYAQQLQQVTFPNTSPNGKLQRKSRNTPQIKHMQMMQQIHYKNDLQYSGQMQQLSYGHWPNTPRWWYTPLSGVLRAPPPSYLPMSDYLTMSPRLPPQPPAVSLAYVPMQVNRQFDISMHDVGAEFLKDAMALWAQPMEVQVPLYNDTGYYSLNQAAVDFPENAYQNIQSVQQQQLSHEIPQLQVPCLHSLNEKIFNSDQLCKDLEDIRILDWGNSDVAGKPYSAEKNH